LTANQHFHLILADIAMAAAIAIHDKDYAMAVGADDYTPACIRDAWLARTGDAGLRQRVMALASAALRSLQDMTTDQLTKAGETYGVPLSLDLAGRIADHFAAKRDAVLTYDR
jgi:hypothetical protein